MNRHTAVTIAASVVIAGTLGFSAASIVVAESVELGATGGKDFSYFRLIHVGKIAVCNPTPLYAEIDGINISIYNREDRVGQLAVPGMFMTPDSSYVGRGQFASDSFNTAQYLMMHIDAATNENLPVRMDTNAVSVVTEVETRILGFVPYTATKDYPALDFVNSINENGACVAQE